MKKHSYKMEYDRLRTICINNEWFTQGSSEQYAKLFEMCDEGASIETLATIIWTCSDGCDLESIRMALDSATVWPIYLDSVQEALHNADFGQEEQNIILEALKTHPDNGICFKTLEE